SKERLRGEKETLGLYLTGHPIDEYKEELAHFVGGRIVDLKPDRNKQMAAGLVIDLRVIKTRRGDNMAVVTLDDSSGRIDVAIFADAFQEYRDKIVKDALLVLEGQVTEDDYTGGLKMRADQVKSLFEARVNYLKGIDIDANEEKLNGSGIEQLADILAPYQQGDCPIRIHYNSGSAVGEIALGEQWLVAPEDDLLHKLRELFGLGSVHLRF
ncbi:MAG: OB-fold nucleic acid binding domain-containing protein, partial [Porticoccus sp.]